ncbi:MAG: prepilin-type N-terminal cleavage/methylation domain-containing protein [Candidatus Omnitrophica bacterium]|nr:prepilin-type N-terminal cleavage/methylation domain-containing protein [Candidatus Omnitrophota bacterium]
MQPAAGFSLMELMIVVIVIGILAVMAFPQFQRATEQGYFRAARDIVQTIYSGEQVYRTSNNIYVNPATCAQPWRCIYMDNPNGNPALPVTFTVGGIGLNTFTVTATRNGGNCNGKTQTLDQNRTVGGTSLANTWC